MEAWLVDRRCHGGGSPLLMRVSGLLTTLRCFMSVFFSSLVEVGREIREREIIRAFYFFLDLILIEDAKQERRNGRGRGRGLED